MAKKKISTKGVIKEVSVKAGGVVVKLGDLKFTTGQAEALGDLAWDKEPVIISIEPAEEKLPGMEK